MKKLSVALLALVVLISLSAAAQYGSDMKDTGKQEKASAGPKAKDVVGTIGEDGMTFTSDKGKKTWKLVNPEAVKGHEGHHVKLNAHFYPDKGEAHVMSLSMNTGKDAAKKDEMKH